MKGKLTTFDGVYDYELNYVPKNPPRKKRHGLTEEMALQISCVVHYDKRCRLDRELRENTRLYAVNPVPQKSLNQAVLSKRAGLRRGIADLHFMDRRKRPFQYTWCEMKSAKGSLSPEQTDFMEWLSDTPIRYVEIRSLDEFIKVIDA